MFCKECGTKNGADKKFCKMCGTSLVSSKQVTEESSKTERNQKNVKEPSGNPEHKKIKPANIKLIGLVALVVLLLFGSYKYFENYYTFENQRDRYLDALESLDVAEYSEVIQSLHPGFEVTEGSIQPLVDYLENDQNAYNSVISTLLNETSAFDPYEMLYLTPDGKYLGMFDKYSLVVNPVEFNIYTNISDVNIFYGDEDMGVNEEGEPTYIGLVAPGKHKVSGKVNLQGEEAVLEETVYITHTNQGDYIDEVYLDFEVFDFYIYTDVEEATVYMDDREIGKIVDSEGYFGPTLWKEEQTVTIETVLNSGETYTKDFQLEEYTTDYWIDIYPEISSYDLQNAVEQVYDAASVLAEEETTENLDSVSQYLAGGEDNDLLITYKNTGERYRNSEGIDSVSYRVDLLDYELMDMETISVSYELYITEYGSDYNSYSLIFDGVVEIAEDNQYLLKSASLKD